MLTATGTVNVFFKKNDNRFLSSSGPVAELLLLIVDEWGRILALSGGSYHARLEAFFTEAILQCQSGGSGSSGSCSKAV